MGIFSFLSSPKPEPTQPSNSEKKNFDSSISAFNTSSDFFGQTQIISRSNKGYVYSVEGLTTQDLNYLIKRSPLHSSILKFKKRLSVGNGYEKLSNEMTETQKIEAYQLLNQFDIIKNDVAMDYFNHSKVFIKVTWNKDSTRIIKLERIAPERININTVDAEMNPVDFLYNWDWSYFQKYPTIKYAAFDPSNKKDKVQVLFYQVSSEGQKLYSDPEWVSALEFIIINSELGQYHKANILNSINPSMLIQYFEKPVSKEKKQEVLTEINQSFKGSRKTGRLMVTFADGKELSPTVTQMSANSLDKTFLALTDTIQREICYAHQIDPLLLGLKTPGSLGNSGDFAYTLNCFLEAVIQPAQLDLENIFNMFLATNRITMKIKFKDPNITLPDGTTSVPVKASDELPSKQSEAPIAVNEHLKNLTGKQTQGLMRIIRQYNQGKIAKAAAAVLLKNSFGLGDADIETFLSDED